MRRISLFHDFGGVGERFTGIATTRKILKSNKQMVGRVVRAKLVAINYILNPANKKSVLQTMAKNLKVANPERIKATYLDIVDGLPRSICPTVPGVRSVLKLIVDWGSTPKRRRSKTKM